MTVHEIIILARKHVMQGEAPMQSSAELCLREAIELHEMGDLKTAKKRAIRSLAYSIGEYHPDYPRPF
tara:strand:- start:84 stop:287 length:204 start_codon:yes stop_codon:yes gene_type:complete